MNTNGNRILWGYAALVAALSAATACTEAKDPVGAVSGGRAIEFSIGMQASRATGITASSLYRIGVFGYSTPQSGWDDALAHTCTPDYFLNKMVVRTDAVSNVWRYDGPTKYWPGENEGMLTFFAYAPFVDVQDIFTLYPSNTSQTGSPAIAYTPPADAIRQIDLLWDKQADLEFTGDGAVHFTMRHALTSIAFEARVLNDDNHSDAPYTIEVLSVGIGNAVASGVFDLNDGEWVFDPVTDASQLTAYRLTPEEHKGLNSVIFHCQYDPTATPGYTDPFTDFVALNKPYGIMMILPQEFRDGAEPMSGYPTTAFISYRTTNLLTGEKNEVTQEIELASHLAASSNSWQRGRSITYRFIISLFDGVALKVKTGDFTQTDKWQPGGEAAVDVN